MAIYDPKSLKAEEFINDAEIHATLEYAYANKHNAELIDEILEKARPKKTENGTVCAGLSHREAAVLLACDLPDMTEKLFKLAEEIKLAFYGNRIVMFAPLYLSNYCVNGCVYCPYHLKNKHICRKKLTQEEVEREVAWALENGFKGIKLHPDFQKFYIDEESAEKFYRAAAGRLPILFHVGDDRYEYSKPARLVRMAKKYPELTFIAAHFGGYSMWDEATEALAGLPNLFVDCSSSMPFLTDDKIREYIRRFGEDRVLFGSDYPMWTVEREVPRLLSLGLSESALCKIFSENAVSLFRL